MATETNKTTASKEGARHPSLGPPAVEYVDVMDYMDPAYPFQIFMGGWGVGKTYSALKGVIERGYKFIYMRRTTEQLNSLTDPKQADVTNPFKSVNTDFGWNIGLKKLGKKVAGIYNREVNERGENVPQGELLGAAISLFGLASIRGIDMTDMDFWIYDEFCREMHEQKRNGEFKALIRGYETIARNRELRGQPPLPLFLFSNTDDLYNDILIGLGLVHHAEQMQIKGEHHKYFKSRGLALHLLETPPSLRREKEKTALYKLMAGTNYISTALDNEFGFADFSYVGYMQTRGMRPLCHVGKAYIYCKKGDQFIYVSYKESRCDGYNPDIKTDVTQFLRTTIGDAIARLIPLNRVRFESYDLKAFMYDIIGIN